MSVFKQCATCIRSYSNSHAHALHNNAYVTSTTTSLQMEYAIYNASTITSPTVSPIAGPTEGFAWTAGELTFAGLMIICILGTVVGNILVILSIVTYRALRCVSNYFLISLAVADLTVATLVMPGHVALHFRRGIWSLNAAACNVWLTLDILTCTASILNLCAIAADRYYAVHDPLNYLHRRTGRRVVACIAGVWGVSALISAPPLLGWNNSGGRNLYDSATGRCELTNNRGFVVYSALGSFYIPLTVMALVYAKIFVATRRRLRIRAPHHAAKSSRHRRLPLEWACCDFRLSSGGATSLAAAAGNERHEAKPSAGEQLSKLLEFKNRLSQSKERRAARTMAIIVGVFVMCWSPFFVVYLLLPFCTVCERFVSPDLMNILVWLGYYNSTLNPIIYTIFNIDFRKSFKELLQCKCKRR